MKEKIRLFLIKKNLEGLILKKYFFMYNNEKNKKLL